MDNSEVIVKLGFTRLTPSTLVEKGRNCVTMLTDSEIYTDPTPALATVTTACNTLDTANQAYAFTRSRLDKAARNTAYAALKLLMRELGAYVQANCLNSVDAVLSAGFEVEKEREPIGVLPATNVIHAVTMPYPRMIEVRWKGVRGRSMYKVEMAEVVNETTGPWTVVELTTRTRHVAHDLATNGTYSFRVTTLGTAGASPVSVTATAKAA